MCVYVCVRLRLVWIRLSLPSIHMTSFRDILYCRVCAYVYIPKK